jgi:nucleotide-binding universal stress UspA family protein
VVVIGDATRLDMLATTMSPDRVAGTGRIVAGIDGSEASLEALSWAARQADLTGSVLEVVMTWEWPSSLGWAVPVPEDFDPEADVRRTLDNAIDPIRVAYAGIVVEGRVVNGHPAPSLVEAASGADLLVVGSRGHGQFVGMLLGSVSEYCVSNAECPVLVHRATP